MRIERGTVIAERYVVSAIEKPWLADAPDAGAVCLALDAILDDPVILYVADQELAGDLLDAGRRLSLVNDPRIPTVLDVGTSVLDDETSLVYIAAQRTAATSLAEILAAGPIGPTEARAIAGEVSEVLVHAGRRGLHHRCLGPESIGIMADGDVVVHGIAIDAALSEVVLGLEVQTDATALREDALAIVDILYACLSAQWPTPEARAGLPAAPRKNQRVVDIEQLRRDIPEDLTAFVTGVTSHTDPGPRSPGEIIRYLREWDRDSLADLEGSPLPDEALFTDDSAAQTPTAEAAAGSAGTPTTASPAGADTREADSTASSSPAAGAGTESTSGSAISTSAGAGAVGAKPTANTRSGAPVQKRTAASSTGMGATGARPTTAPPTRPAPSATPAPRQATPDQIQAALARIGMTRPGTSGFSAGRTDGVHTKLDERMQMREASVFPLSGRDLETVEAEEWTPEQTYSDYESLSAAEYDADMTAPIMNRDAMWDGPEDVSTQQMPVVPDPADADEDAPTQPFGLGTDDDASTAAAASDGAEGGESSADGAASDDEWFLGGVFTTREEQIREQRAAFERERALEKRRADAARRAVEESEARTARQREASKREAARREDQAAASATDAPMAAAAVGAAAAGTAVAAGAAASGDTASAKATSGGGNSATTGAGASGGGPGAAAAAPASAGGRSPRERRRITFLVLAALLVVVVVIGFFVFGGSSDDQPEQTAQPTQEATAPPDEGEDEEDDEPEAPAPEVESVEAIDPEGDDEENSDAAELVLPGAEGGWQSERYNSAEFGGLKSGLGLMFELEEESQISSIDLSAPDGEVRLEVRVGDSDDVEDAETVAEETAAGDTTIELDEPATGSYVFLWYTQAAPEGGGYRVMVDEVEIG